MEENTRDVVVIGPGAIGGAVAAALIQSGCRVTIAARTGFETLLVTYPTGRVSNTVRCVTEGASLGEFADVVLAVKAHQSLGAAAWLERCVGPTSTIYVLQNGVEHVERIAPLVPGTATIVPVVIALPSMRTGPGEVVVGAPGTLTAPAGPGGSRLDALIASEFVRVRVTDDWTTAAWVKLMLNAASGGVGTLARRDGRMLVDDSEAQALTLGLMLEVAAVARAEGADLSDERAAEMLAAMVSRAGTHLSSIVVDRLNGQPTEWDARNAVIGRIGARHGIETPLNSMVTTLIRLGEPDTSRGDHDG